MLLLLSLLLFLPFGLTDSTYALISQERSLLTSLPSSISSISSSVFLFDSNHCDSIALSFLRPDSASYFLCLCFNKHGTFFQSLGFFPFYYLQKQTGDVDLIAFDAPVNYDSRKFNTFDDRPSTFAISAAGLGSELFIAQASCSSLVSELYSGQHCGETFFSHTCDNSTFDLDADILGNCKFSIHKSDIDYTASSNPTSIINSGDVILYHEIDIPEPDESDDHANPALDYVHHAVGTVVALKDLDDDGDLNLIVGGIVKQPVGKWEFGTVDRICCEVLLDIDSDEGSHETFSEWQQVEIGNGRHSLRRSRAQSDHAEMEAESSFNFYFDSHNRILPDDGFRPAKGLYNPDPLASVASDITIKFTWGLLTSANSFAHGEVGFVFGMQDYKHYYVFMMSNHDDCGNFHVEEKDALVKVVDGKLPAHVLAEGTIPEFYAGQRYEFEIVMEGNNIKMYRDEELRFDVVDNNVGGVDPYHGTYGFYVWDQVGAYFQDIRVETSFTSGLVTVNQEPTEWVGESRTNSECLLKLFTGKVGSALTTLTPFPFPCPDSSETYSCSSSWVSLTPGSNDMVVDCSDGINRVRKVISNWSTTGASSIEDYSVLPSVLDDPDAVSSLLEVDFQHRKPVVSSSGHHLSPLITFTVRNGGLYYRHLLMDY
ncbi:hypothetical protein P9112_007796 [Eukaryota sp. TZLM1-RC]